MTDIVTITAPPAERAALALNSTQTERDLIALASKNADITVIKNKAGRDQAHGAAMEIKRARLVIEKTAKEARDDATKFSKAVIAEEKRLISIIEPEETRLLTLRNSWDAEQERIRLEAEAAEQRRIDSINAAIDSIRAIPGNLVSAGSKAIFEAINDLAAIEITEDAYQEFTQKAEHFRIESLSTLRSLLVAATQREAEAQRLAEEQARIAEERARLEAEQKAEAARLAEERDRLDAERKAEAARLASERAELERLRAEAQASLEAERAAHEAHVRAEQERIRAAEAAADATFRELQRQAQAECDKYEALQRRDAEIQAQQIEVTPDPVAPAAEEKPVETDGPIPDAIDFILTIAEQYGIDKVTARDWLVLRINDILSIELL